MQKKLPGRGYREGIINLPCAILKSSICRKQLQKNAKKKKSKKEGKINFPCILESPIGRENNKFTLAEQFSQNVFAFWTR